MNTRAAGRGTTTAGIAATTDAATTVAAAGARGRQGTTRDVIYQPGYTLTKSATLSGEPDHVGEPVVDRLQHGPVSSGWTVFRPAAGEPVVDRLQHRSSSSRRRKPSAHERTGHHVPPGTVDLPGLWTPAHRRAESGGRRGGRPQAVGNLAGERRRPCLRTGREIPTVPQRIIIIIDIRVRTGLVPTVAAAGQCRSRGRRGRDFAIGIHLNQALELSKPPGPRQRGPAPRAARHARSTRAPERDSYGSTSPCRPGRGRDGPSDAATRRRARPVSSESDACVAGRRGTTDTQDSPETAKALADPARPLRDDVVPRR